ncbi:hypothetical protein GWI33_008660, partial [Rhynchophorus ferrugineus]
KKTSPPPRLPTAFNPIFPEEVGSLRPPSRRFVPYAAATTTEKEKNSNGPMKMEKNTTRPQIEILLLILMVFVGGAVRDFCPPRRPTPEQ